MPRKRRGPYEKTKVSVDASRADIDRLLEENGAEAIVWSTAWKVGKVSLVFLMKSPGSGRRISFRIEPPIFKVVRKSWSVESGSYVEIEEPNGPQSMRMLYFWLKSKFEQVRYGLREIESEFLNEMIVTDGTGRETTVGTVVRKGLESGRLSLPGGSEPEPIEVEGRAR